MEVATGWPTDDRRVWDGDCDDRRKGGRLGVDSNRQTLDFVFYIGSYPSYVLLWFLATSYRL